MAGFATLLLVLTPHLGRQWVLLDSPPRKLTAAARSFSLVTDLLEPTQTRLALDTTLAHSASLAPGTPVLTVRLSGPHGVSREWSLRSGLDTGEWAAAREQLVAPSAWTSWVDGSGHFFGQRYRKVLEIGIVEPGSRLDIELVEGLPEDTAATLYRVTMSRSRNSEAHALTGRALG